MNKIANEVKALTEVDLYKIIDSNTEIVIIAPWNGKPIPVTIRILDSVSLTSCGEFNTVSSVIDDDKKEEFDITEILKVKNIHEGMVKLALVHPTFKELEEHLIKKDFYTQAQQEIKEIEELIEQLDSEVQKNEHMNKLELLKVSIAFILPEDFTSYIVTVLLQQEATEVNKLTRDTLLHAGFLGERYNKRPSEFIEGIFTDKQKVDVDVTALTLVIDYREQQNINKNGMKWIGKGGKR